MGGDHHAGDHCGREGGGLEVCGRVAGNGSILFPLRETLQAKTLRDGDKDKGQGEFEENWGTGG